MAKSIIPIGKPLGWVFNQAGELQYFEWLRGDDNIELSPNEAMALAGAFEDHGAHFDHRFDRSALIRVLQGKSETLPEQELESLIDGLLSKGLLEEVDLRDGQIDGFLRRYRIIPTGRSFGNSQANPDGFGIGGAEPLFYVSGGSQTIWAVSHSDGSIWRGCELQAEHLDGRSAIEVAREFASVLPVIIATECGFLERA
jgi:hypothetical protein